SFLLGKWVALGNTSPASRSTMAPLERKGTDWNLDLLSGGEKSRQGARALAGGRWERSANVDLPANERRWSPGPGNYQGGRGGEEMGGRGPAAKLPLINLLGPKFERRKGKRAGRRKVLGSEGRTWPPGARAPLG